MFVRDDVYRFTYKLWQVGIADDLNIVEQTALVSYIMRWY